MISLSKAPAFLFVLAFLLHSYRAEWHLISPDQLIRLTLILWFSLAMLYYLLYLILRDRNRPPLLLTVLVFGFCFSQIFFYLMGLIVLAVLAGYFAYCRLRRLPVTVNQISFLLSATALVVVFLSVVPYVAPFSHVPWLSYLRSIQRVTHDSISLSSHASHPPDIYYIVLDGYPRSDVLGELYEYDNTKFVDYLRGQGFVVPGEVTSNYGKTALSIPSTLSSEYIDSLAPDLGNLYFWWLMKPFIDSNRATTYLESQGYKTVSVSTGWTMTENRTSDVFLHPDPVTLTDFERYFLNHTALRYAAPILERFTTLSTYNSQRRTVRYAFDAVVQAVEITSPKFVFVHVISPHPPFVFDADGNPVDPAVPFSHQDASDFPGSAADYKLGYIAQIEFVNAQMQAMIDAVLSESKTPPIILIQSDHGSGLLTNFSSAEKSCLKERFSPFAAYYLPGIEPTDVPPDITAVNLFRFVFNQYFDTQLPMLETRQYASPGVYLYQLTDVTSQMEDQCSQK